jgi:hypothetical protein
MRLIGIMAMIVGSVLISTAPIETAAIIIEDPFPVPIIVCELGMIFITDTPPF